MYSYHRSTRDFYPLDFCHSGMHFYKSCGSNQAGGGVVRGKLLKSEGSRINRRPHLGEILSTKRENYHFYVPSHPSSIFLFIKKTPKIIIASPPSEKHFFAINVKPAAYSLHYVLPWGGGGAIKWGEKIFFRLCPPPPPPSFFFFFYLIFFFGSRRLGGVW